MQWQLINFFWLTTFVCACIQIFLTVLCFKKKHIVFPLIIIFFCLSGLSHALWNVRQIATKGFVFPVSNIWGMLVCVEFVLAFIGVISWIRERNRH